MSRFFFHMADNAEMIIDDEGLDLPDLESAKAEAELSALDFAAECVRAGKPVDGRRIIVQDDRGITLMECGVKDLTARLVH